MDLASGSSAHLLSEVTKRAQSIRRKSGWDLVFVFDGLEPPMKASENQDRLLKRNTSRQLGVQLLQQCEQLPQNSPDRKAAESAARDILEKDPVVGEFAPLIFAGLRAAGFEAYVAHMCRTGFIFAVFSEDTDTIMYFAPRIIRRIKEGVKCDYYDFNVSWGSCGPIQRLQSATSFVAYCVLSGCDYLEWPIGVRGGPVLARWIDEQMNQHGLELEELLVHAIRELAHVANEDETLTMVTNAAYAVLHHLVIEVRGGGGGGSRAPSFQDQQLSLARCFPIPQYRQEKYGKQIAQACGDESRITAQGAGNLSTMFCDGRGILEFPPAYLGETIRLDDTNNIPSVVVIPPSRTLSEPPQSIPLRRRQFEALALTRRSPPAGLGPGVTWWCTLCHVGLGNKQRTLPEHLSSRLHVGRVYLATFQARQHQPADTASGAIDMGLPIVDLSPPEPAAAPSETHQ